ncbi:hypothetical protein [Pedobacter gandavensis]|uniref:hypothetical protein n=1 Tax=Pedobacter gandavensis TaxID=2679963 RepID=UPI002931CA62|nr:hypothetical protein [Pedobacter gandavensis]
MKTTLLRIEMILKRFLELKEEFNVKHAAELEDEVWLDNQDVMKLLRISPSSFYRKLKMCNWKEKMVGGKKYYLKSSII